MLSWLSGFRLHGFPAFRLPSLLASRLPSLLASRLPSLSASRLLGFPASRLAWPRKHRKAAHAEGPLPAVVGFRLRLCSSACLPGYLPKASEDQGSVRSQVGLPVRLCPGQVEPTLRSALRKRLYPMPVLPARPGSQLLFVRFLGENLVSVCDLPQRARPSLRPRRNAARPIEMRGRQCLSATTWQPHDADKKWMPGRASLCTCRIHPTEPNHLSRNSRAVAPHYCPNHVQHGFLSRTGAIPGFKPAMVHVLDPFENASSNLPQRQGHSAHSWQP